MSDLFFFTLFAMAVIWLVMVWYLFRRLAADHAGKYEELGKPSLFSNNNFNTSLRVIKFLFTREPESLADTGLTFQVNIMRIWIVVYLVGFSLLLWMTLHHSGM